MTSTVGLHWIPTHRGDLGGVPDRDIIARWNPPIVKIVTIDNKVPYLEDVPLDALILVRNHPMSENYGNRGLMDMQITAAMREIGHSSSTEDFYEAAYWKYWKNLPRETSLVGTPYVPRDGLTAEIEYEANIEAREVLYTVLSPELVGAEHARTCNDMAAYCESKGVPRSRLIFEGLNEPQLWTAGESPELVARYYLAFLKGLHAYGLAGCVGNFGVGWPGNSGAGAPVEWAFFEPVINEMRVGDYLGLHEYWALNGPQENWLWWAGRFLQCPYQVPILITECGIDTGVTGQWYGGWRDLPGNSTDAKAARYVSELLWYAQQCAADGRSRAIFPFTYDIGSSHWEKFDIRGWAWLDQFFLRLSEFPTWGGSTPPPPPPPAEFIISGSIVSRAPNAATSYVHGYCLQPNGAPWNNKQVFYSWRGNASPIASFVSGKGEWPDGYFSVPMFPPDDGMWDFWCYDPVRQLTSDRLQVDVDHEQVEIKFQLTSASVTPPPEKPFDEWAWEEAKSHQTISLNPNAAIQGAVLSDNGGSGMYWVCLSNEFDATWSASSGSPVQLVMQLFGRYDDARERIYYWRKSDGAIGMLEY